MIAQPAGNDNLNSPEHDKLHCVIAADTAAAVKSIQVSTTQSIISAPADSTTAIQFNKADLTTNVLNIDTTNGRVGIGTTSPGAPLHVVSSTAGVIRGERTTTGTNALYASQDLMVTTSGDMADGFGPTYRFLIRDSAAVDNVIANFGAQRDGADNSGKLVFQTFNAGVAGNNMVIDKSGNVGIGTTSPAYALDIYRSSGAVGSQIAGTAQVYNIWSGASGTNRMDLYVFSDPANGAYIGTVTNTKLGLYTNNTEKVTITTSGNVGIGTTTPAGILDVDGRLVVLENGNVGIGITAPLAKTHIDQSSTTGAVPVLTLDQGDVSEELIRLIGTSAADNTQSLVDAADLTTPGAIAGWIRVYIQDDAASGAIADGIYFLPFYSTPTA